MPTSALTTMRLMVPETGGPPPEKVNPTPNSEVFTPPRLRPDDVGVVPNAVAAISGPRSSRSKSTPIAPAVNVAMPFPQTRQCYAARAAAQNRDRGPSFARADMSRDEQPSSRLHLRLVLTTERWTSVVQMDKLLETR